jgi:hypothetical protein
VALGILLGLVVVDVRMALLAGKGDGSGPGQTAPIFWQADFYGFYTGWKMILNGEADRLYDLDRQRVYQARVVPGRKVLLPYVFPPHRGAVLAPLALLEPSTAFCVWAGFQLVLVVILAWLLRRLTADWLARDYMLLLATVLAFFPLWMTFILGQVSLLLAVCLLGFYLSLKRGWASAAALCLVVGTIKPQLVLVPAATLLAAWRWRELAIATALFAAWATATALVLGWEVWPNFFEVLRYSAREFDPTSTTNPLQMLNLKGFLTAVLGTQRGDLILVLSAVGLLAALAATAWIWRGPWEPDSPRFELRAALTLMLGLIANPHFFPQDAIALVVPSALFVVYLRRRGLPARGFVTLALAGPLLFLVGWSAVQHWPGTVQPFFLVMVLATAWMGWAWVWEG